MLLIMLTKQSVDYLGISLRKSLSFIYLCSLDSDQNSFWDKCSVISWHIRIVVFCCCCCVVLCFALFLPSCRHYIFNTSRPSAKHSLLFSSNNGPIQPGTNWTENGDSIWLQPFKLDQNLHNKESILQNRVEKIAFSFNEKIMNLLNGA